jgi:hypothetical protein
LRVAKRSNLNCRRKHTFVTQDIRATGNATRLDISNPDASGLLSGADVKSTD